MADKSNDSKNVAGVCKCCLIYRVVVAKEKGACEKLHLLAHCAPKLFMSDAADCDRVKRCPVSSEARMKLVHKMAGKTRQMLCNLKNN